MNSLATLTSEVKWHKLDIQEKQKPKIESTISSQLDFTQKNK